ncbi:sugar phosphate isomerase/epimerase family protein [Streptomyces camelliae]|uniref:Sugar phosphate isomerase/epimerase n=1 Tax=Streptomyces camelliae TaxID=3004093 RepID=A0ABY7PGE9_9ACTN|nr:sugar phosphate isomerase/epimerase family protein [Streptomyces sp. HUAS 2-6]WBO68697.1 sugar phosphate isomerase/epimerase [Streptomyces sp. HUAS 2-6]
MTPAPVPAGRLRFGFGTNGFTCHRLDDVLTVLADLGYDSVGLTLDHGHLDPFAPDLPRQVDRLARRLDHLGLAVMVETGAPYLLDPWHKHVPTLMSATGSHSRVDLLARAVRIAAGLGAPAVHLCSGPAPEGMSEDEAWKRLTGGCEEVLDIAREHGVALGFEPEPYMFVDTVARVLELRRRLGHPEHFGVTLDIGHAHCVEDLPLLDCVETAAPYLVNVQIEDMRRGVHEHLELGAGEIDFPPVLAALKATGYQGPVSVEIQGGSLNAPDVARRSLEFLKAAERA